MRFNPAAFNRLLSAERGLGQEVAWRRGTLCPCRDKFSGAARQGCPTCDGRGVFWGDHMPAWTGLASQRSAREWAAFGQWESGDVVLSIPSDSPLYDAGENDRIVMVQSSQPFSLIFTRGEGDRLRVHAGIVSRVVWLDPDSEAVVDGALPMVGADGEMVWPDGEGPAQGQQYTIMGRHQPEYFLFKDLPQDRAHAGGMPLPRRVVARRFDLFGR